MINKQFTYEINSYENQNYQTDKKRLSENRFQNKKEVLNYKIPIGLEQELKLIEKEFEYKEIERKYFEKTK